MRFIFGVYDMDGVRGEERKGFDENIEGRSPVAMRFLCTMSGYVIDYSVAAQFVRPEANFRFYFL